MTPPRSLVGRRSVRAFNALAFRLSSRTQALRESHYSPYFFALDRLRHWNRLYGPDGLLQHQCVIPRATARDALSEILARIDRSRACVALATLKRFGDRAAAGWMSFARPGISLALDLPRSRDAMDLLDALDRIVDAAGGGLYPAKDARMAAAMFRRSYPRWEQFAARIDPRFSSGFWRRVTEAA